MRVSAAVLDDDGGGVVVQSSVLPAASSHRTRRCLSGGLVDDPLPRRPTQAQFESVVALGLIVL